jgi:ubiquinone/menaquinone biosynthesis C-methylase UbiE
VDVIGADLSSDMLTQARRQARGPLLRMDLRALAFGADSFAGVWCIASLLHLPKAAGADALGEIRRVLRPAGVLALSVQEGAGEDWEAGPFGAEERFFARYTAPELAELLRTSGFTVTYQARNAGPQRHWLQFLARCPASR